MNKIENEWDGHCWKKRVLIHSGRKTQKSAGRNSEIWENKIEKCSWTGGFAQTWNFGLHGIWKNITFSNFGLPASNLLISLRVHFFRLLKTAKKRIITDENFTWVHTFVQFFSRRHYLSGCRWQFIHLRVYPSKAKLYLCGNECRDHFSPSEGGTISLELAGPTWEGNPPTTPKVAHSRLFQFFFLFQLFFSFDSAVGEQDGTGSRNLAPNIHDHIIYEYFLLLPY